jgi:hypothetical protein
MIVKATLSDCTVSGPNAVTVVSGTASGKLGVGADALTLTGPTPVTGTIKTAWHTTPAFHIRSGNTVMTPNVITPLSSLIVNPLDPSSSLIEEFAIGTGTASATGSFSNFGSDGGASSTIQALNDHDFSALSTSVSKPPGLKAIDLGPGASTNG